MNNKNEIVEEDMIYLASRLREIRKGKNLTQKDIFKKCGLTQQTISKIENMNGHEEGITLKTLLTYIDALDSKITFCMRKNDLPKRKHLNDEELTRYILDCKQFITKEINKSPNTDIESAITKYVEKLKNDNINIDDIRKIIFGYVPSICSNVFETYLLNEGII